MNNNNNESNVANFPLLLGWVLKEKQKYGKKGAGKRITKKVRTILEGYFLAGNANKSNYYNAQDMHQALQKKVLEGEIENKDVPKISTIQN
ncbi:21057_t:CDS:2 [Gigaspora margarita]|uniref:21057_t:CDS:1 n=1 Tax=Gigaspora margarita TaxID=4874 RepID=A0ABN7USD9_GIGMA|nr:21057_t:CDS:2 [Gigaspora margarita]